MPEMPLRGRRKPVFGDSAMARMPEVRTYVVESYALRRGGSLRVTSRGRAVTYSCGQVAGLQAIVIGVLNVGESICSLHLRVTASQAA